jgi:hypothetical protein
VCRFGKRRHIRLGDFASLHAMRIPASQDLIVCSDVLQYVPDAHIARGLRRIQRLLRGVAYIEAFTKDDDMTGDMDGWHVRPRAFYDRAFREAGLTACGLHCYVGRAQAGTLLAMERL